MQSTTADILKPKQLNSFMSRCINSVIGIFDQIKQLWIKIKSNAIIMNFSKRLKLLTLENQMNRAIQLHPFSSLSIILELYTLYIFNFRFRWRFNHFQMTFCAIRRFFFSLKKFFFLTYFDNCDWPLGECSPSCIYPCSSHQSGCTRPGAPSSLVQ